MVMFVFGMLKPLILESPMKTSTFTSSHRKKSTSKILSRKQPISTGSKSRMTIGSFRMLMEPCGSMNQRMTNVNLFWSSILENIMTLPFLPSIMPLCQPATMGALGCLIMGIGNSSITGGLQLKVRLHPLIGCLFPRRTMEENLL